MIVKHQITLTTDALGDVTARTGKVAGKIVLIKLAVGTLDAGGSLTITGNTTATPIITVAAIGASDLFLYPRASLVNVSNAAITNSHDHIRLSNEQIKAVVAAGGNAMSGTLTVWTEE